MYTIISTIVCQIILTLLNLILYSDVASEESQKRLNAMSKIEIVYIKKENSTLKKKIDLAAIKLHFCVKLLKNTNFNSGKSCSRDLASNKSFISHNNRLDISPVTKPSEVSLIKDSAIKNLIFKKDNKLPDKFNYKFDVTNDEIPDFSENFNDKSYKISNKITINLFAQEKMYFIKLRRNYKEYQRDYIFSYKHDSKNISCFSVNYSDTTYTKDRVIKSIKEYVKVILILSMILFIWYYLIVMITTIYLNYGNNLFKVCIMPLISSLVINLLIIANLLIFVATTLMYYKGKEIYNSKHNSLLRVVFNAFVPITAKSNHQSILMYRAIVANFDQIKR